MIIKSFLSEIVAFLIPFIVPACLIASFIMNHDIKLKGSKSKATTQKESSAPITTNKNEKVETQKVEQPDVTGSITELAEQANNSEKIENPYKDVTNI